MPRPVIDRLPQQLPCLGGLRQGLAVAAMGVLGKPAIEVGGFAPPEHVGHQVVDDGVLLDALGRHAGPAQLAALGIGSRGGRIVGDDFQIAEHRAVPAETVQQAPDPRLALERIRGLPLRRSRNANRAESCGRPARPTRVRGFAAAARSRDRRRTASPASPSGPAGRRRSSLDRRPGRNGLNRPGHWSAAEVR